ncbi:MAG: hypothetical protein ACO3FT_04935 [Ilumatobacteraceae bacterium]|jgi:hypothetical protein
MNSGHYVKPLYQVIVCADGARVSVQASRHHYATPRNDSGPYTHVEAGFPSVDPPASWRDYAEDPTRLTDTVYSYMPYDCVEEFITMHGGMVEGVLPPNAWR